MKRLNKNSIFLNDCSPTELLEIVKELDKSKSSDIPIRVIKKSAHVICPYLSLYFNHYMTIGHFWLLARRKTFHRGSARIRAEMRRLRPVPRGSGELPPKYFSADSAEVRRTFGGLRADPRGLRGELAEEFTRKMSADKNLPNTTVPRGKTSAADVLPPRR